MCRERIRSRLLFSYLPLLSRLGASNLAMPEPTPTLPSVLETLTRERLFDLGRVMGAGLTAGRSAKREIVGKLTGVFGPSVSPVCCTS